MAQRRDGQTVDDAIVPAEDRQAGLAAGHPDFHGAVHRPRQQFAIAGQPGNRAGARTVVLRDLPFLKGREAQRIRLDSFSPGESEHEKAPFSKPVPIGVSERIEEPRTREILRPTRYASQEWVDRSRQFEKFVGIIYPFR